MSREELMREKVSEETYDDKIIALHITTGREFPIKAGKLIKEEA